MMKTNYLLPIVLMAYMFLNCPATNAQLPTSPCTSSMLTSFTPCINYITNSTSTGTSSPATGCCNSLRSLMSNGSGCFCQIVTGGVPIPIRLPINRTLAISLPKACNQPGVPVTCKASPGSPIPAPGPTAAFGPSASSPAAAVVPGPAGSTSPVTESPALAPISDTTPTTEGSVPATSTPTATSPGTSTEAGTGTGTGAASTPSVSASMTSLSVSPLLLFSSFAILMVKYV